MMSVGSAMVHGFYLVALKKTVMHESRLDLPLFLGFLGLFIFVCFWPILFILHLLDWEMMSLPPSKTFLFLFINAFVGSFLSDYFWLLSMLMTSPVIASFGLCLTIPLALLADWILKNISIVPLYFVGTALVLFGFICLNLANLFQGFDQYLDKLVKSCWRRIRSPKMPISSLQVEIIDNSVVVENVLFDNCTENTFSKNESDEIFDEFEIEQEK